MKEAGSVKPFLRVVSRGGRDDSMRSRCQFARHRNAHGMAAGWRPVTSSPQAPTPRSSSSGGIDKEIYCHAFTSADYLALTHQRDVQFVSELSDEGGNFAV
jgi:hypothetical protein